MEHVVEDGEKKQHCSFIYDAEVLIGVSCIVDRLRLLLLFLHNDEEKMHK